MPIFEDTQNGHHFRIIILYFSQSYSGSIQLNSKILYTPRTYYYNILSCPHSNNENLLILKILFQIREIIRLNWILIKQQTFDNSPNISKEPSNKMINKSSNSLHPPHDSIRQSDRSIDISKMSVTKLTVLETLSRKAFILYSLVPMYICVLLSIAYPHIIGENF